MGTTRTVSPARPGSALVLAPLVLGACASLPDLTGDPGWPTPTAGAVVSEHPLATDVGLAILDAGGNAADAAVATALALAVVYPQAGNLGGGGFAIVVDHDPAVEPLALDFRETAPADLDAKDFLDEEGLFDSSAFLSSPLIVGVPGSPDGLFELHRVKGRLPWELLVQPAIDLAAGGFEVGAQLERTLTSETIAARLTADPASSDLFYPGGEALTRGARIVQPALAATLTRYRDLGPDGVTTGPPAAALVELMAERGGRITAADLAGYEPRWLPTLRGWFRGREVITMPPPSSGGLVLLQVLAILDGMPLDAERDATAALVAAGNGQGRVADPDAAISARTLHWWIEAMRRAYADRAEHMGDPSFHPVPTEELLAPAWIASRRVSIGELADPTVGPWLAPPPESGGETTHLSVLDAEGNAVSLTTTLNTSFGTGILVPGAGYLLNNELDDFAIQAGVPNVYGLIGSQANALEPGKRPLSSMTPTVIRDGGEVVTMVIGSPGGPRIISAVIEVVLRTLVHGQGLAEAIAAPRVHQQWRPIATFVEPGWEAGALEVLEGRGHELDRKDTRWASVQAIRTQVGGRPEAASDPRRGGTGRVQE